MNAFLVLACLAVQSVAEYVEREDDGQVYVVRCIFWPLRTPSIVQVKCLSFLIINYPSLFRDYIYFIFLLDSIGPWWQSTRYICVSVSVATSA